MISKLNIHTRGTRTRWAITAGAGALLWEFGNLISGIIATIVGGSSESIIGNAYPMIIYSILRVSIFTYGIYYTWKLVDGGWSSIGFDLQNWRQDSLYGAAVGVGIAVIQYLVILPLTGGALRSDIIAASELVGTNYSTLVAAIILISRLITLSPPILSISLFCKTLNRRT